MATAGASAIKSKEISYSWEGKDKSGKVVKGEMRAAGEAVVNATLRRQGILVSKVKKKSKGGGGSVGEKDVSLFTRQMATMMKAGVPLLQAFDIVGKGHSNAAVGRLLMELKTEVETGSSLAAAFRKYPLYFRRAVLQPDPGRRSGRHLGNSARPGSPRTRKKRWPSRARSSRRCSIRSRSSWSRSSSPP